MSSFPASQPADPDRVAEPTPIAANSNTTAARPMTVLIVVPTLGAGAAEHGAVELVRCLKKAGHHAIVAARAGRLLGDITALGGEFVALDVASKNPIVMLRNAAALVRLARRRNCDVIHALGRAGATPIRMTLAGVGIGAVLSGITSALALTNQTAFSRLLGWSAGSVTGPPLATAGIIAPLVGVGVVIAILLSRDLNALALGDDLAAALGSRAAVTRAGSVIAITVLCGAATAAAGPIGFVGLMIPHVARWIVGPDQRWILGYAILLGPSLVIGSDVIGRLVLRPSELPVGVVTAFVGAPVLILLVRRAKASGL